MATPEPTSLPIELPADPARQAVATIVGYVYQIWVSIDAWFRLQSIDEVIYLEGAEDLDKVGADEATTQQIKHEAANISLNNKRAHSALENFWTLRNKEQNRRIAFHYITTATAATEKDANFDGLKGIEAWHIAETSLPMAKLLQAYLLPKLSSSSPLSHYLTLATDKEVQSDLICRFHWLLDQPGVDDVKNRVADRLTLILSEKRIPLTYVARAQDRLYSYVSATITQSDSNKRRLTAADLLREIDAATIEHISIPAIQYQQFMAAMHAGAFDPGEALLRLMRLPIPDIPSPLLARDELVARVRSLVSAHESVLLTGTVFKGKTTIAQVVAHDICPDAWWFPVTSRSGKENDTLLRALGAAIELRTTPRLIVLDDVDLSGSALSAFHNSFALVLNRAAISDCSVLLTARGSSENSLSTNDYKNLAMVDIPELSVEEVKSHCEANACPNALVKAWGLFIHTSTRGHPKLVQVRIAEVAANEWPCPSVADVITPSPAILNARQIARTFLHSAVSPQIAKFVYTAAEATFPLTRQILICLTDEVGEIANGGDVIDALQGKWFERVAADRFRITPILTGSAADTWSSETRKTAHQQIYDAIARVRKLDVTDAAALLMHAFVAEDGARLIHCIRILEEISKPEVSAAIFQHLMWVPLIGLTKGARFFSKNLFVSVFLRRFQFAVATGLDSDSVLDVLERWSEEIEQMPLGEPRDAMRVMLYSTLLGNRNVKIPIRRKLAAIEALSHETGQIATVVSEGAHRSIDESLKKAGDIPTNATPTQFFLSLQGSAVRSVTDLGSLLDWLEQDASPQLRGDFEKVLHWPLVDSCGAFVHGAWSSRHTETTNWDSTISMLGRANDVAIRFNLRQFGSEVARAASIILSEYVGDHAGAMAILERAAVAFGDTPTILEQRVNALFQIEDYIHAMREWEALIADSERTKSLDAFSFRRAGITAAHLQRWGDAEKYFLAGAAVSPERGLEITKYGLTIDAAYMVAISGAPQRGARMLADLFLHLPGVAAEEGREDWEALLRFTHSILEFIADVANPLVSPLRIVAFGKLSQPGLSVGPAQAGQRMRFQLVIPQVASLASRLGSIPDSYRVRLAGLTESEFPLVRFATTQAILAFSLNVGTDSEFPNQLAQFERALGTMRSFRSGEQATCSTAAHSETAQPFLEGRGWFSGFVAAALCCDDPFAQIGAWRASAASIWGPTSGTVRDLAHLEAGLSQRDHQLWNVVNNYKEVQDAERVGAAIKLLQTNNLQPDQTYLLQSFLASAILSTAQGVVIQDDIEPPVARRFAKAWKTLTVNQFLFYSPRSTIPALVDVVTEIQEGRSSLKALLTAASHAVGRALGEIGDRLK
jgi:hypothetical protein